MTMFNIILVWISGSLMTVVPIVCSQCVGDLETAVCNGPQDKPLDLLHFKWDYSTQKRQMELCLL